MLMVKIDVKTHEDGAGATFRYKIEDESKFIYINPHILMIKPIPEYGSHPEDSVFYFPTCNIYRIWIHPCA